MCGSLFSFLVNIELIPHPSKTAIALLFTYKADTHTQERDLNLFSYAATVSTCLLNKHTCSSIERATMGGCYWLCEAILTA